MDVDFHYYATFAAARLATWSPEDAHTIAYAAQFIDEFEHRDKRIAVIVYPWLCLSCPDLII